MQGLSWFFYPPANSVVILKISETEHAVQCRKKLSFEDEEWERDEKEDIELWRNYLPLRLADDDYKKMETVE